MAMTKRGTLIHLATTLRCWAEEEEARIDMRDPYKRGNKKHRRAAARYRELSNMAYEALQVRV